MPSTQVVCYMSLVLVVVMCVAWQMCGRLGISMVVVLTDKRLQWARLARGFGKSKGPPEFGGRRPSNW